MSQSANIEVVSNDSSNNTNERPVRSEFYKTIVIKNNGATVDENSWKDVIATGTTAREVRKQLKNAGMQAVRVFDSAAYKNARIDYRDNQKTEAKVARESLITRAFQSAGFEVHPRLSSSLRTLLPMFKDVPTNKTVLAFKNIIKNVSDNADMTVHKTEHIEMN